MLAPLTKAQRLKLQTITTRIDKLRAEVNHIPTIESLRDALAILNNILNR